MIFKNTIGMGLLAVLAGCAAYPPAMVENGVIRNPHVGWNGYALNVPEGLSVFNPANADPESAGLTDFQRWYMKEDRRSAGMWYVAYTERFLLEHADGYFISFICDSYELPRGWMQLSSVEVQFTLQQVARRKMVEINDDEAHSEVIEINGQRAVYVSGNSMPYFKKNPVPLAYEGYFVLGRLREGFWVEGFSDPSLRQELKRTVREVVENLEVHE
jgi:hypothetical protein